MKDNYVLTAKISMKDKTIYDIDRIVTDSLNSEEGVTVTQTNTLHDNPKRDRIVRAALDLLAQKIDDMDTDAEDHLAAYSLNINDVSKDEISSVINQLFP